MFRVLLLTIGLALVVAMNNTKVSLNETQVSTNEATDSTNEKTDNCERVLRGGLSCCKKDAGKFIPPPDDIEDCFRNMPKESSPCYLTLCIAMKKGIALRDGSIIETALAEQVEIDFRSDPALVNSIKKNCIEGDISKYGKQDLCDLMKVKLCSEVQTVKRCNDWYDEGDCSGVKAMVAECIKQYQ